MMGTQLLQDLRTMQRMTPIGAGQVVLSRTVFDEIVDALAGSVAERDRRAVLMDELMAKLTPIESRIVKVLHEADGEVVQVVKFRVSSTESLRVHMRRLREKLRSEHVPFRVETVRERGYRMVWEEENAENNIH